MRTKLSWKPIPSVTSSPRRMGSKRCGCSSRSSGTMEPRWNSWTRHWNSWTRRCEWAKSNPAFQHMHLSLLDNRIFSLQNLDRLAEADETVTAARAVMDRHHLAGGFLGSGTVNHFWAGRWEQSLTEVVGVTSSEPTVTFLGLQEFAPTLLLSHGIAALIAVLRDDGPAATAHLAAADDLPMLTMGDRENCDFLLMAEALAAERDNRPDAALMALVPVLDLRYARMMLRHQWLPDMVRIALHANAPDIAARALDICETEARLEKIPARATAAAARCRSMISGDPTETLAAAQHYRRVGRPVELAYTLEDAAVLLGHAGRTREALSAMNHAARRYHETGAVWAIRRLAYRCADAGLDVPAHIADVDTTHGTVETHG